MLRIRLADSSDISTIASLCVDSLLGTKILCQINAYGLERDFLSVWCAVDEDENMFGVICKFEDSITLKGSFEGIGDELKVFLDMIGFSSLCCDSFNSQFLHYKEFIEKKAYCYKGNYDGDLIGDLTEDYHRDCYFLISKNIPDSFSDTEDAYLSFLSDFTFRKRRNMARMKGYTEGGKLCSCALTSAETEVSAIISGVACDTSNRKRGLGRITVLSLAEELKREHKEVYVIALNESAEGFYEHIGFQFKEKITFIERK